MTQVVAEAILQDVRSHLDAVMESGRDRRFQDSESVVRSLAAPKELRSLIGRITSDENVLTEIAANSYYHANNFFKIVLLAGEKRPWKLRLHMWHPTPNATGTITEDVHSHRWDFTTALLAGEYFAQEFRIGPGPEYHHVKYWPIGRGNTFTLEAQGKEQLTTVFEAILPAGTIYHIDHQVLHRISRSADKTVASLVLQQPAVTEFTNVYRTSPTGEATTEVEVQRPSIAQLREELTHLLTWLS